MAGELPVWNLTDRRWAALVERAQGSSDALEDGAYVRVDTSIETDAPELHFYATALNKPAGWRYPFTETIPQSRQSGAFLGRVWHETATGFAQLEVIAAAAAQAVTADYESGVGDMDYVAYETAVAQALRGTFAEATWLHGEFGRLVTLTGP